ncbi:hypothetical protein HAX54_047590, partial [Datura stramonium]|nr:hypothetical protein [Datura stramonium]
MARSDCGSSSVAFVPCTTGKTKVLLLGGDRVGTYWDMEATRGLEKSKLHKQTQPWETL